MPSLREQLFDLNKRNDAAIAAEFHPEAVAPLDAPPSDQGMPTFSTPPVSPIGTIQPSPKQTDLGSYPSISERFGGDKVAPGGLSGLVTGQGAENAPLTDEEMALLDLKKRTVDEMNKNGEVTSTRMTLFPGGPEVDLPAALVPVFNAATGFNSAVATALSIPNEVAAEITNAMGLGIIKPGEDTAQVKKQFQALGIQVNPTEFDSMMHKIGYRTAKGLAELGVLIAAAPGMAANTGQGAVSMITKALGEGLKRNPGLATVSEIGSAAGAEVGKDLTSGLSPGWQTTGELTGAVLGGIGSNVAADVGANIAGKLGRAGAGLARGALDLAEGAIPSLSGTRPVQAARGLVTPEKPDLGAGIRDPNIDPSRARVFAQEQLEGDKLKIEEGIAHAIESVPTTGTPAQVQSRVRTLLEGAERIGNRIVGEYWNRVPIKERVPMTGIRSDIREMAKELQDRPSVRPTDFMDRLYELGTQMRGDDGRLIKSLPTIEKLRDERAQIRLARLAEEGKAKTGGAPNDGLVRNYNRLESIIDQGIDNALASAPHLTDGQRVALQQARRMSITYNNLFSRGVLADVMARRARGDPSVPPGQTVDKIMNEFEGPEQLQAAAKKLAYLRAPGQNKFAITSDERKQLQALTGEFENSIRSSFREAAKSPEEAVKFIKQNESAIKPLARVSAELSNTADTLGTLMDRQKLIQKSALSKFAQQDAQKSVQSIFAGGDPKGVSAELMKSFGKDIDARDALRAGVLDELFVRSKLDPINLRNMMETPRIRDMLENVLDPGQLSRLSKVVDVTNSILRGDEHLIRHTLRPSLTLMGRIFGAGVGRQVSHFTGGGTIQIPGYFAQIGRKTVEKLLRTTDPKAIMSIAVLDPKWEKVLLGRAPRNTKELRDMHNNLRRMVAVMEGSRGATLRGLAQEDIPDEQ